MTEKQVDARGLPCPQPVLLTRKALAEAEAVVTVVDNGTSQHNVTRMAERAGHTVRSEERDDGIYLYIARADQASDPAAGASSAQAQPSSGRTVVLIASEEMGRGEHAELGGILSRAFLHTLGEIEPLPSTLIFLNSGVKLTAEGSPVVEDLQALAGAGVEILACGTCLEYYDLKDRLAVGEISNMYAIAETLLSAGNVVSL